MRLTLRAAGLLAFVVVGITCSDAPTAPQHGRGSELTTARIALAPSFSAAASRVWSAMTSFGFDVTNVHIQLTTADGRLVRDTVIAFPVTQDTLHVDLSVQIQGSEQSFTARIELRDANNVVLFSGSRLVTARVGLPGAVPTIQLDYAGPGRDARTMSITPTDITVSSASPLVIAATALDSAGRTVSDLVVRWSSSDVTVATVTATSDAAAELRATGKRGTVTVTAVSPTGLSAAAHFTLVPPASRLVVVSGGGQTGAAGHALAQPFVVEVQSADGGPVSGVAVAFRAVTADGSVATATTTSDATGRASTALTLGGAAGAYIFEASSGTLAPVTITATATPTPATALAVVSGDAQSGGVGRTLPQPFVVKVTDDLGAPVSGATVDWTLIAGAGALGAATSVSDANGLASMSYTLGALVRVDSVRASLAGVNGTGAAVVFTATGTVLPGVGGTFVLLQPLPSSIPVGVPPASALRVQLADASGHPIAVSDVEVTATGVVTPGNTPAVSIIALSDAAGIVTFNLPAYVGAIGSATITLTSPGFTPLVTSPIAFVTGSPAKLKVITQPSVVAPSGTPFPVQPTVQLLDVGKNPTPLAGVTVTAFVASGGGVLGGTAVVTTDATGSAIFTDLSITGSPGFRTLGFSSGSLPDVFSNQIDLTGNAATALDSVPGFQLQSAGSSTVVFNVFKVRLVDNAQQTVTRANVPITVRATAFATTTPYIPLAGTVTRLTDAAGVATFDDIAFNTAAGTYALTARADSTVIALPVLTLVDSLTLFTGPAASIAVSTGARTIGASNVTLGAGTITFQVKDALGSTTPSRSYTVSLSTVGNCSIQPSFRSVNTGFTSSASVPIDLGPGVGGCIVSATTAGVASPATAQIALPPANATHVWFGAPGGGTSAWEGASGWLPVPPMTAGSWPSSQTSDDAFVPYWNNQYTAPQLTAAAPLAIRRLHVDSLAMVDLGGKPLIVAGDSAGGVRSVKANGAQIVNGQVLLYGNGALVTGGVFDRLSVGDALTTSTNFCASNSVSALLRNVIVLNALDVHCKLVVDSTVAAGTVRSFPDAAQPGWILLGASSATLRTAAGDFAGDSLVVDAGLVDVAGVATFGGRLSMAPGTTLQVTSDANFQGGGTLSNAQLIIGRNATFGGLSSFGYSLVGGSMAVGGNFTQIVSGVPTVFVAASDHLTLFNGSTSQQVSFANPVASGFSQVQFANSGAGVQLGSDVSIGAGTSDPRAALLSGAKLFVGSGTTLSVLGNLLLGPTSALDVAGGANVQLTGGSCNGRTTNTATLSGSGNVNGVPITAATCIP